jgi:hypothetical protein
MRLIDDVLDRAESVVGEFRPLGEAEPWPAHTT